MNTNLNSLITADQMLSIAYDAYKNLPDNLRDAACDVVILVEEFPHADILQEFELESPYDLLGLYDGVSMLDKSVLDTPMGPDTVTLYRQPILDYWDESQESLENVIRHVLIHEIGHHFGFSDEDMEHIEQLD